MKLGELVVSPEVWFEAGQPKDESGRRMAADVGMDVKYAYSRA